MKLQLPKKALRLVTFLILLFVSTSVQAKSWKPSDLKAPVFRKTGMVVNPDGLISTHYIEMMAGIRGTYFYNRYIEPVYVSVENISGSGEDFAEGLAKVWDLESKTNGRYIIQLRVGEFDKFYFKVGWKSTLRVARPFAAR